MATSDTNTVLNGDSNTGKDQRKYAAEDFELNKLLGSGSYSNVFLATDKKTKKQFALKVLEKRHIIREKKVPYVSREKDVMLRINHPLFIQLYFTFQDKEHLYFGLTYANRGELLDLVRKVGCFDEGGSKFYSAEIIEALEYLHGINIIHRDLKPENILLDDKMHIKITDFGTAKILESDEDLGKSFVGTAQYVSPELLNDKVAYKSSDLWAFGCIVYQLVSGRVPFHAPNEYQCFQKILKLEYSFPDGFSEVASELIQQILILDPAKRLGSEQMGGYPPLKSHAFFSDIDWDSLLDQTPPQILPFLPSNTKGGEAFKSDYNLTQHSSDDEFEERFLNMWGLGESPQSRSESVSKVKNREQLLKEQATNSPWHTFVNNELIVKQGLVDKRKGLFAKRRQLILTDAPRLYYIDPVAMELKGEIPWSEALKVEQKNWKTFFVHTPNRTYYLEDPTGSSQNWTAAIDNLQQMYIQQKKSSKGSKTV